MRRFYHEMFSEGSNEEATEKAWEQNVFVQVEHTDDLITQCTDNLPVPMVGVSKHCILASCRGLAFGKFSIFL